MMRVSVRRCRRLNGVIRESCRLVVDSSSLLARARMQTCSVRQNSSYCYDRADGSLVVRAAENSCPIFNPPFKPTRWKENKYKASSRTTHSPATCRRPRHLLSMEPRSPCTRALADHLTLPSGSLAPLTLTRGLERKRRYEYLPTAPSSAMLPLGFLENQIHLRGCRRLGDELHHAIFTEPGQSCWLRDRTPKTLESGGIVAATAPRDALNRQATKLAEPPMTEPTSDGQAFLRTQEGGKARCLIACSKALKVDGQASPCRLQLRSFCDLFSV